MTIQQELAQSGFSESEGYKIAMSGPSMTEISFTVDTWPWYFQVIPSVLYFIGVLFGFCSLLALTNPEYRKLALGFFPVAVVSILLSLGLGTLDDRIKTYSFDGSAHTMKEVLFGEGLMQRCP